MLRVECDIEGAAEVSVHIDILKKKNSLGKIAKKEKKKIFPVSSFFLSLF